MRLPPRMVYLLSIEKKFFRRSAEVYATSVKIGKLLLEVSSAVYRKSQRDCADDCSPFRRFGNS